MDNKEHLIQTSLSNFLHSHSITEIYIDEIVLSYVISILEDLGNNDVIEEAFDVDEFSEMMNAYLPGFENISSTAVCEWMFELSAQLSGCSRENESRPVQLLSSFIPVTTERDSRTFSESSTGSSSSSMSGKVSTGCGESQVQVLLEMFPAACAIDVQHCLSVTDGDVEAAAQMLITPDESKENTISVPKIPPLYCLKKKGSAILDDKCVKDQIVQKYSYIDLDEDKKTFRPPPVKKEPKKMVRYLDGRIVTTKGERFTEIKKEDDEDQKKTYVNLKPAKQYRFH